MIHVLRNDALSISIDDAGAELIRIYDRQKDREILWQADPSFWKRHAPVLFPNVGRNYNDICHIGTEDFHTRQHGFARDSVFTCVDKGTDFVTHQLKSSDETKAYFPYDFVLSITHKLEDKQVTVSWKVENPGRDTMYFTIGGHPAFRVPVIENTVQSGYSLTFSGQAALEYVLLDQNSGTALPEQTQTLELTEGSCKIAPHMFDQDALVFDHGQIQKAGIAFPDGTPYLELTCEGFPNFGIWSVPGAPFVCLEPWMGRCDNFGFADDISQKPDINKVNAGDSFQAVYCITVF